MTTSKKQEKEETIKTNIKTRGRTFIGTVISDKMHKTATIQWESRRYIPKYERYKRRRTTVKAHNPEGLNAKKGDLVKIKETRPLSKTKNFIITEILDQTQKELLKNEILKEETEEKKKEDFQNKTKEKKQDKK